MRTQWTDELIELELRKFSESIGHFPTITELRTAVRNDLGCAATKRKSLIDWSNQIGVSRSDSDSDFGWRGEEMFLGMLATQGIAAARSTAVKAPFDILADSILRIDVKTAKFAEYGACRGWFYRIAKDPQADLIILLQADTRDFYALPWPACPTSNVTISRDGGKYAKFKNDWPRIRGMIRDLRGCHEDCIPLKDAG